MSTHVIPQMVIPEHWTRIRGMDWGSAAPFCVLWAAVSDGEPLIGGAASTVAGSGDGSQAYWLPKDSLVMYREWYGWNGSPNKGCRMMAEEVGEGIREREDGERIDDEVLDPAAFASDGGPSIAERLDLNFRRADNKRIAKVGAMGGWDSIRERLRGTDSSEHKPLVYFMDNCIHTIRTLPALQHDMQRPEDIDTTAEDHCFTSDTLVYTDQGIYPIAELIGKSGRVRSLDGLWHDFRSARLTRRDQPTVRLTFSDGSEVKCTKDHLFLTNRGWKQAQHLAGLQTLKSYRLQSKDSWDEIIISVGRIFVQTVRSCIGTFGQRLMGKSRSVGTFITRIIIKPITQSVTWTVCRDSIIKAESMALSLPSGPLSTLIGRGPQRAYGTNLTPDVNGIKNITNNSSQSFMAELKWPVSTAASSTCTITGNSVRWGANRPLEDQLVPIAFPRCVLPVGVPLFPTNIQSQKTVQKSAEHARAPIPGPVCLSVRGGLRSDVYCITVPDTGNFALASGIIVANCGDTLRYICMSRPVTRKASQADNPRYLLSLNKAPTFNELVKRSRNKRMEAEF